MPYSAVTDVRFELGNPDDIAVPSRAIQRAQTWATNRINGRLRTQYSTIPFPDADVPPEVKDWEIDLAVYWISRTKWFANTTGLDKDTIEESYDKAIKEIEMARKGEFRFGTVARDARIRSRALSYHPTMDSVTEIIEQGPDPDLVDLILDERADDDEC